MTRFHPGTTLVLVINSIVLAVAIAGVATTTPAGSFAFYIDHYQKSKFTCTSGACTRRIQSEHQTATTTTTARIKTIGNKQYQNASCRSFSRCCSRRCAVVQLNSSSSSSSSINSNSETTEWNGEVVSNTKDGRIRGCIIRPATEVDSDDDNGDGSKLLNQRLSKDDDTTTNTDWVIQIDGVEADLGRFSAAIYKKLLQDAKQQRYQGYRPGTLPPPLLTTYKAYAMDECARETILEAMEQNNIRPFEDCRTNMFIYSIRIPPSWLPTKGKNKKSNKKKITTVADVEANEKESTTPNNTNLVENKDSSDSAWKTYTTMKEAIDIGKWEPGQSFSFMAKNIRGQKVKLGTPYGTSSLGVNY